MLPSLGFSDGDFDQIFYPAWTLSRGRRHWVRSHTISYAFIGDEFMPNPDFVWPRS